MAHLSTVTNADAIPGTAVWELDPLGHEAGGQVTVDRVSIVRIACVAAEAGARMQRDGLATDPVGWMLQPATLFSGRPPIEACMALEGCAQAILLHGLGLGLDADPATMRRLRSASPDAQDLEAAHGY